MMTRKSIVVLANSYKPGGRCIAGKEVRLQNDGNWELTNEWIRPISSSKAYNGSIFGGHYCINNREIRPLDIVTIDFISHTPELGQPENWLIDEQRPWVFEGQFEDDTCARLADRPNNLWVDSGVGVNINEVSLAYGQAGSIESSLTLIKPDNFTLTLSNDFNPWKNGYCKGSRVSFSYNGARYSNFSMTDSAIRSLLEDQYPEGDGSHVVATLPKGNNYHFCISLSPVFDKTDKHYKLVAALI